MTLPQLPVSNDAICLSLNLATLWFMAPEALRPRMFFGFWKLIVTVLFHLNIVLAATNLLVWLMR